jgi:hypothetical protein
MRPTPWLAIEPHRIAGDYGAAEGAFRIPSGKPLSSTVFQVIASSGMGWEHVSVSLPNRCPFWDEMCFIKSLFWGNDETVIQYHPAASEYVNVHPFCLHLWRPIGLAIPTPPTFMV